MTKQDKIRIGILFGGKSGEHEVSFCSASSIIEAIDREKYEIIPIGITKDGCWLSSQESIIALRTGKIEGKSRVAWKSGSGNHQLIVINKEMGNINYSTIKKLDVIFPVLHGPFGEDGTVQGLLELINIPYVGAGVSTSSLAMDKDLMKKMFQQSNLPQTKWITIKRREWSSKKNKILNKINNELTYPLFVKPTNLGSSVGINKVENALKLEEAINIAALYDRKIIIEEGIEDAIEVECSVLGNDKPNTSVIGEVVPAGEYYDYQSKYIDKSTRLIIPARVPDNITKDVQKIAKKAFLSIDGSGLARVDFFVQKIDNTYKIFLNEINTMPGFTRFSMYPKLWEKSGIGFSKLIDRLIELAFERFQDKILNRTDYPSILLEKKF
ncbi:MAG: D-alanine--D-alanine ligase family protein [Candidatus Caldatribacteriota bacterium]|jgi:D-alanine-D-alanine ligase|nr:D-alanine--D-alanine ligase [Atribacterota bacterium]